MEEPLELQAEPPDETERAQLPAGCFSGVEVLDSGTSLDSLLGGAAEGLTVAAVVENSPAQAAGIEPGDLLLAATGADGTAQPLRFASEWRQLELTGSPGSTLRVQLDRAGVAREVPLTLVARVRPAARSRAGERLREERRVGVVVRAASEVEARAAGLAPGGGAVVVGLSRDSPWRTAGVRFGDLVCAVDGVKLAHPQQLLAAIGGREAGGVLTLEVLRDGQRLVVPAAVSARRSEVRVVSIPVLFSYEKERDQRQWSVLWGLLGYESTAAAWEMQLLWLVRFGGSTADQLREVDR